MPCACGTKPWPAAASTRRKADFAGPMAPIAGFSRARQASQRMAQLIDDLLNLSRVARAEMRQQRVNLSQMAESIAAELQKAEPDRHVRLHIQPGIMATGDDRLLCLVMENLLGNAFKFTRKKSETEIEFGN